MIVYLTIINLILLLVILFLGRKIAEYRQSKVTLRRLMNHTNIGYYRYRYSDGVVLEANKGFADILELGIKSRELVGRSLSELLIYVDDEESIREKIDLNGPLRNYEYHFKTLKGKDKWVLHNSYIIRDPYTGEKVIEAWVEDITEERLSYEAMKRSQERYEKLFKNSGDMVMIYRFDNGVVEEVNPQVEFVTGFDTGKLTGRTFDSLFHPLYRKKTEDIRKDLIFKGTANMESVIVCQDGRYTEVSMTLSVTEVKEDKIVIAIIRDVSAMAKERAEEERRKKELEKFHASSVEREERIKELREELKKARQQLERSKGKKGD